MTIIYSAPIFTMIFSAIFLRLRQGLYKIFFAVILILGVLLVIRPPFMFPKLQYNVHSELNNQTTQMMTEEHLAKAQNMYWIGVAICVVTAACTGLISVVFNHLQVMQLVKIDILGLKFSWIHIYYE